MKEMFLYRGCTAPVRHPQYEAATIAVLEKLGVRLSDMKDANCCGAQYVESLNRRAFAAMCGRILALAERFNMDILTICGACTGSLKHNQHYLDTEPDLRAEVNSLLKEEGLEYTGKAKVKHLLQVLNEDIGYDRVRSNAVKPYANLKLAAHYGCHMTRPHEILQVDDPDNPMIIDNLIAAVGGTPVDYAGKTRCCGGPMLAMDADVATLIGQEKIENIRAAGGQGIVTACVFCDIQLTQVQFGEGVSAERLPVITIPQLLGITLGLDEETLGIEMNKISPDIIMEALQEAK